jgi:hypothetical protein
MIMNIVSKNLYPLLSFLPFVIASCKKDGHPGGAAPQIGTITIENVLDSRPLVESGTFQGTGTPPVILPGQSTSIDFYAAKGEALSFATMYGWSNDLYFAPANPGILAYDSDGNPVQGDVSSQIRLWDNGTRVNQKPGSAVSHPGAAESRNISEVSGTDAQGNTYLPASQLVKATLKYNGNSMFTLTLQNISGGTANETPLSPGVWSVSYIAGGQLLMPAPLYSSGKATANGLTNIAEAGDNTQLYAYIKGITGIFTPLSPTLVVIYNGIDNPVYKVGENDRGKGLRYLAQRGVPDTLAAYLKNLKGVKAVYNLAAAGTRVLLPVIDGAPGGKVSQAITLASGDRMVIATMYGFSNDWFFATDIGTGDLLKNRDISSTVHLYNDGTAVDQFPGAGVTQFNLAGTPLSENTPISLVPNPNAFTTLPDITQIIKISLQ